MAKFMTTNALIKSIKRRGSIPENQRTFNEQDFVDLLNEEMNLGILPEVLKLHEDYYLQTEDTPLVANTSEYSIPKRAIGNKLRDINYKDDQGNVFPMTRIMIDDLPHFQSTHTGNSYNTFYVKNNKVVIVPSVGESAIGNLQFSFYQRPNELVIESRAGIIESIDFNTGDIVLVSMPDHFTATEIIDMVSSESPYNLKTQDITITGIDSVTRTISLTPADIPSDLSVGDHIMTAQESIVPQLPTELHVMLAHMVVIRCLESLGDSQGVITATAKLSSMRENVGMLIDNRVEGAPQKAINRNNPLREAVFSSRYRRRNR